MTTLREEIYGEVIDYNLVGYKPQILVNQILKLIDKRIDELIKNNTPENPNNLQVWEQKNMMYYRLGLEDLKEMLLK